MAHPTFGVMFQIKPILQPHLEVFTWAARSPLLRKLLSAHIFAIMMKQRKDTHRETFTWANCSPLLSKEGLGVVSLPPLFKTVIYRMLLFNHP